MGQASQVSPSVPTTARGGLRTSLPAALGDAWAFHSSPAVLVLLGLLVPFMWSACHLCLGDKMYRAKFLYVIALLDACLIAYVAYLLGAGPIVVCCC